MIPNVALRKWVLTLPYSLRGLSAVRTEVRSAIAKVFVEEVFTGVGATTISTGSPEPFSGTLGLIHVAAGS